MRTAVLVLLTCFGCDDSRTRHVLVIGLDGVRGDALAASPAQAMRGLAARGLSTFAASTQLSGVTKSGPGWASILSGVEVDKHLVIDNDSFPRRDPAFPSLVKRAHDAGVFTCAWVNWFPLWTELFAPEQAADRGLLAPADTWVLDEATMGLHEADCGLTFIHLDDVDKNGHLTGFSPGNPNYMDAIARKDADVAALLAAIAERPRAAREDWLVIVATDHGGEGLNHGPKDAVNRTIPMIVAGPGITPATIDGSSHLDVAPTALHWLGIPFVGDGRALR